MIKLKRKEVCRLTLLLASVFAVVYVLTQMTPLVADDFNYAFKWGGGGRVRNFWEMFFSMGMHRFATNGRVFAHGWVTLFMMWPRWVFPVVNAAVVMLFSWGTYRICRMWDVPCPDCFVLTVLFLLWICMPAFGQVFLWLDGAVNYFWGAALSWTVICWTLYKSKRKGIAALVTLLLLPLSFVAGAWSEHISFSMLVILLMLAVYGWVSDRSFPFRQSLMILFGGLGYLYLMSAPSMLPKQLASMGLPKPKGMLETVRAVLGYFWWALLTAVLALLAGALLIRLLYRKKLLRKTLNVLARCGIVVGICAVLSFAVTSARDDGLYSMVSSTGLGLGILITVFSFGLICALRSQIEREQLAFSIILFLGGISAVLPFSVAAYRPARGLCAPVVFGAIATAILMNSSSIERRKPLMGTLLGVFLFTFVIGTADIVNVHHAADIREEEIAEVLCTDGILRTAPYPCRTKYSAQFGLEDLRPDSLWPNDIEKEYYGLQGIIVDTEE